MNKVKESAIFPGQIKINNKVFFGLDYELTDFYNELAEDNKRLNNIINELEKWLDEQWTKPLAEIYVSDVVKEVNELKEKEYECK